MSAYVDNFFAAGQAATGGVVRRSAAHVNKLGVLDEIVTRARRSRFHVIETGGQIVVLCNEGDLVILC